MSKIFNVIMYEGDNSTFVWKHPCEDFNKFSQLVVHESQEAVLFSNGKVVDMFGPGRYTLDSENIPVLRGLIKAVTRGENPFHCEIYFVNKTVQMGIKWGTDSKVRFIEPLHGIPVEIGASGELNLCVCDSHKLVTKLVGTMNGIAWSETGDNFTKSIQSSFRPLISTAVKTHLAASIKLNNINILEIDENLEKLSDALCEGIKPGFEEYGLTIPQFYINNVLLPEDDANFKELRVLHATTLRTDMAAAQASITAAQRQVTLERQTTDLEIAKHNAEKELIAAHAKAEAVRMAGLAEADVMHAKGYDQRDVLNAEVQKAYAEGIGNVGANGTGNGVVSEMLSLGVGMAAINAVGNQASEMFGGITKPAHAEEAPAPAQEKHICNNCGATLPENCKFCLECGTRVVALDSDEMICPVCNQKIRKGKFCMECGASLIRKCEKCGTEAPLSSKFCMECGEKF